MRKQILIAGALGVVAFAVWAQENETIAMRQTTMGEFGKSMKALSGMMKGEVAFDAAAANEALSNINTNALKLPDLFPADSSSGTGIVRDGVPQETEAAPSIWEKPDEFSALVAKFIEDTGQAAASGPQDVDALKASVGMFAGDCKTCHENFRIEKK